MIPYWLSDAHETYSIMAACPQYAPAPDELGDFQLRVMAQIHEMHRRIDLENLAKLMGATDG